MSDTYDITVTEGTSFDLYLTIKKPNKFGTKSPVDLTGFTVSTQIRQDYNQASPVLVDFSAVVDQPSKGSLVISLSPEQTKALGTTETPESKLEDIGFYDVILTSPAGAKSLVIGGKVTYKHAVTREEGL